MLCSSTLLIAASAVVLISEARVSVADAGFNAVPTAGAEKVCYPYTPTMYIDRQFHYDRLRHEYGGCTHVMGDLHIALLDSPNVRYDLSFLKDIRYVSGHVAIFANEYPAVVSLPKLEVIRGNSSFRHAVKGLSDISLIIAATSHKEIYMPNLKEISQGSVLISLNTSTNLCYLDTIDWSLIVKNGQIKVSHNNATCQPCSRACELSDEWRGHCWGPSDDLCQFPAGPTDCAESCQKRCSRHDSSVCCHSQCAVGCTGPSPNQCIACKDYQMPDGTCVSHCTDESRTNAYGQRCVPRRLKT